MTLQVFEAYVRSLVKAAWRGDVLPGIELVFSAGKDGTTKPSGLNRDGQFRPKIPSLKAFLIFQWWACTHTHSFRSHRGEQLGFLPTMPLLATIPPEDGRSSTRGRTFLRIGTLENRRDIPILAPNHGPFLYF